jgi:hypothetical protein
MLNKYAAVDEGLTSEIIYWNTLFDAVTGPMVVFGND